MICFFFRHGSHSRYNRGREGTDRIGKCFQEWSQAGRPTTTGMIVHVHFVYASCCQRTVGIVCGALVQFDCYNQRRYEWGEGSRV